MQTPEEGHPLEESRRAERAMGQRPANPSAVSVMTVRQKGPSMLPQHPFSEHLANTKRLRAGGRGQALQAVPIHPSRACLRVPPVHPGFTWHQQADPAKIPDLYIAHTVLQNS